MIQLNHGKMRILGIVPARGGSKGVPRKNIRLLGGKPLLAYTAESAKASSFLTKIVLSTDDEEIAETGRQWGFDVPFLRPSELALDSSPTLPVIQHALDYYSLKGEEFDAMVLLEVTSPFRMPGLIDSAIAKFIELDADALVSVLPIPESYNPHWAFEQDEKGYLQIATGDTKIIPRRQELPKAFHRDGSIYITKTSVVKQGSLYGTKLAFVENDPKYSINIDTLKDWEQAENWLFKNR